MQAEHSLVVMPGLDPGIHTSSQPQPLAVDCRVKPGNDKGIGQARICNSRRVLGGRFSRWPHTSSGA
jgi:hypothetical protein